MDQQPELKNFSEPLGGLFLKQMFLMLYSHDSHCAEVFVEYINKDWIVLNFNICILSALYSSR